MRGKLGNDDIPVGNHSVERNTVIEGFPLPGFPVPGFLLKLIERCALDKWGRIRPPAQAVRSEAGDPLRGPGLRPFATPRFDCLLVLAWALGN